MKKILTLLACASALTMGAYAEAKTAEIEMNFRDWSTGEALAEPQTTTISYEDGVYTIDAFMNSTRDLKFTLTADEYTTDGSKNYCVSIPSAYFDGTYLKPGANYYKTYLYGFNGAEADASTTINYILGWPGSSFIQTWSPEEYETPIYFCFCMKCMYENSTVTSGWMYFDFYMPDLGDILAPKLAENEQYITMDVVEPWNEYAKFANDITSVLAYEDGEYTIKDFVGTGCDLTFTVPAAEDLTTDWSKGLKFIAKGNTELYGKDAYFVVDTEDGYPFFTLSTDEGDIVCSDPYIFGENYSKVAYNAETDMYSVSLIWTGYDSDDEDLPYLGSEFSFKNMYVEPEEPGADPVSETVYIDYSNDTDYSSIGSQITTVTYDNGVYSIDNFMNSGLALQVVLPSDPTAYELYEETDITFTTENLYDYYNSGMPYLYNYETGKYATGTIGEQAATYIYVADGYATAMKLDEEEYGYPLYISIWCDAYLDNVATGMYASFYMSDLAGIFTETGVKAIENADAPVEYFNLQGVRVANPENGIFIMRQGNKSVKVVK